jgi:Domain of unknown function (DUF1992)
VRAAPGVAAAELTPSTLTGVRALSLLAESKIQAAIAAGELDDLPGHGRPLELEDLSRVPAELRMGFKLLRNAGCLPPELEARKEVARLGSLIAASGDATERAQLSRLRADAEMRYRLLAERRRR